jgi:hypothetical protein
MQNHFIRPTVLPNQAARIYEPAIGRIQLNAPNLTAPPLINGWGSCKACSCSGYERGRKEGICTCGHHFSQHR